MPQKKGESKTPPARKSTAPARTITCPHCRYERPAGDAYCPICGHPWAWKKKR